MPIDPATLAAFASEYAKALTSIRGRRVQRLLKREFAGAEFVLAAQVGSGMAAALGLSASGAALCATDGTGRQATVIKWSHGAKAALEAHFDLHKDSLPVLGAQARGLDGLRTAVRLRVPADSVPPQAQAWVERALEALA